MGNISTAFVESYRSTVRLLAQQKSSRLRKYVYFEKCVGKTHFFEYIGEIEVNDVTTRFGDSPENNPDHVRRACTVVDRDAGTMMEKFDESKTVIDPKAKYVTAMHAAFGRKIDKIIIEAASASAMTGEDGTTLVDLPSTQKVPVTLGAETGYTNAGLNVKKLKKARSILAKNEVLDDYDNGGEAPIFVISQQQIDDLLNELEITSADYNSAKTLVEGTVAKFLGFTFVRTELLTLDSDTDIRTCFAFVRDGIGLCINDDVTTEIAKRSDKKFNWYCYMLMSMGATRMEEEKVVEVFCDESPDAA